jgi:hypothetical protein
MKAPRKRGFLFGEPLALTVPRASATASYISYLRCD